MKEVYIQTPTTSVQTDGLRFFDEQFQKTFWTGAIKKLPGAQNEDLKRINFHV